MKITELGKTVIVCLIFWIIVFIFIHCCTGCGGTFIVPTPIGPISYTTPQLIKPPITVTK